MTTMPKQLGTYDIERELGRGGMGVVYLGRDQRLGRSVAIKTLPEDLAKNGERLARFEREAKTLASLNHAGIATIHALEDADDGSKFLVLEYIEGQSLSDRLSGRPLAMREALKLGRQIAEALAAAHKQGVVHRDLKPSNIMLTPAGGVKILDFGLAKAQLATNDGAASQLDTLSINVTQAGRILGTPGYMSPEQARGLPVDVRTDIFSFGCVLFECIASTSAFKGDTPSDVIAEVLTSEPNWSQLPEGTPTKTLELLIRCLAKDLDARLSDIAKAVPAIEEALASSKPSSSSRMASLETPPSNLPAAVTSFIGRRNELDDLRGIFERSRLVTLTGSGGCGKTRLGVKLAHDLLPGFADGVWHVSLASLTGAGLTQAVMGALGLKDEKGKSPSQTLIDHLRDKQTLLILDGCEHLLGECASLVETLLRSCPNLRVLITSRQSLGTPGETTYRVPSLTVPQEIEGASAESLMECEAVRLFADRAAAASPRFKMSEEVARIVADIVQRIDGIPLAIELAAARVRAMSVGQIARRLDSSFRLLRGGAQSGLERHQTLQATIDWSYSMLTEEEQTLFRRLAVFSGGLTLEAAERVCAGEPIDELDVIDLLSLLVEKSLVLYEEKGDWERYRLLETMRQYALAKLEETDEASAVRDRHLDYCIELVEEAEPNLRGSVEWLDRLSAEQENLLAAHQWCDRAENGADRGLRLVGSSWRLFDIRGQYALGSSIMGTALARPGADAPTAARAKTLFGLGVQTMWRGDYEGGKRIFDDTLEVAKEAGDTESVANAHNGRAIVSLYSRDLDQAQVDFEASREAFQSVGDQAGVATALGNLGELHLTRNEPEKARELLAEAVRIGRRIRSLSATSLPDQLRIVATLTMQAGDLDTAQDHLTECIELVSEFNSRSYGCPALESVAALVLTQSESLTDDDQKRAHLDVAARIFSAAQATRRVIGAPVVPSDRAEHDKVAAGLRERLGEQAFAGLEKEGHALPFKQACQHALEWLNSKS